MKQEKTTKHKNFKRTIAVLLSAALATTTFSGCSKKEQKSDVQSSGEQETEVNAAEASAVKYTSSGEYTTTVSSDKVNFNALSADDITITYSTINSDDYFKALENSEDISEVDESKFVKDVTLQASEVKVNDDNTVSLSFIDKDAEENATDGYEVYFKKQNAAAYVEVEFPDHTLTTNVDSVLASDKDIRLTLTPNEGEFSENVSADKITLSGSFEKMNIESLSAAGKNLTVQLTGDLSLNEGSGVYLDGIVTIAKEGFKDGHSAYYAKVPVQTEMARFVSEDLTYKDGSVTVPLTLIDIADVKSLTADSFTFEKGVKVTDCNVDSDTQVTLTMTVDGATSANSAAQILNGQTVKVGNEQELTASFVSAEFYPVFDFVEEDGENLKITLELYANSGKFADVKPESVSLGADFQDGKTVSIEKKSDTVAELIVSVPANGQTDETLNMDGEVILAKGSLINKWGEATDSESTYLRNYSQENMGKDLTSTDIDTIKEIVGGFGNTTFGTISAVASGASTGFSAVKTILEMTGVIESEHQQVMNKLNEISNQVQKVQDTLDMHTQLLEKLQETVYNTNLSPFDTNVAKLNTYINYIAGYFESGAKLLGIKQPTSQSDREWSEYNEKLLDAMENAERSGDKNFKGFSNKFQDLEQLYVNVATELSKTDNQNPLYLFDQLCTLTYNVDTQCYTPRTAYRAKLQYTLEKALAYILLYYDYGADPNQSQCKVNRDLFNTAKKQIDNRKVEAKPGQKWVYSYSLSTPTQEMSFNTSKGNYAFPFYKRNFTSAEKNEFIKRMNGRPLAKEIMDLAGIKVTGKGSVGIAFSCEKHNDGSWYWGGCRHYTNYYADIIGWDSAKIEKYHSYSEDGEVEYGTYKLWS